jgi:hypothetical protein
VALAVGLNWRVLIVCHANELLVRGAYQEMYDILLEAQEDRLKDLQEGKAIPHRKKIILILG